MKTMILKGFPHEVDEVRLVLSLHVPFSLSVEPNILSGLMLPVVAICQKTLKVVCRGCANGLQTCVVYESTEDTDVTHVPDNEESEDDTPRKHYDRNHE